MPCRIFLSLLLLLAGPALFAVQEVEQEPELRHDSEDNAAPDLTTPEAFSVYLKSEAERLPWPDTVLKKEIGAVEERGRMCVFAIFSLKSIDRAEAARLAIKSAAVFASALVDDARFKQACVTLKCPGHVARLFIPIEALRKLGDDMDEQVLFSLAQKKEFVSACDWAEFDRAADACAALDFSARAASPPPGIPAAGISSLLRRLLLKKGGWIDAACLEEIGGCYLLQDDHGRFMRIRCGDVARVLPPGPAMLSAR